MVDQAQPRNHPDERSRPCGTAASPRHESMNLLIRARASSLVSIRARHSAPNSTQRRTPAQKQGYAVGCGHRIWPSLSHGRGGTCTERPTEPVGQRGGNNLKCFKDFHLKNGSSRGWNPALTVLFRSLIGGPRNLGHAAETVNVSPPSSRTDYGRARQRHYVT